MLTGRSLAPRGSRGGNDCGVSHSWSTSSVPAAECSLGSASRRGTVWQTDGHVCWAAIRAGVWQGACSRQGDGCPGFSSEGDFSISQQGEEELCSKPQHSSKARTDHRRPGLLRLQEAEAYLNLHHVQGCDCECQRPGTSQAKQEREEPVALPGSVVPRFQLRLGRGPGAYPAPWCHPSTAPR